MFVPIDGAYYMYNKHYVIVHDREVYKVKQLYGFRRVYIEKIGDRKYLVWYLIINWCDIGMWLEEWKS